MKIFLLIISIVASGPICAANQFDDLLDKSQSEQISNLESILKTPEDIDSFLEWTSQDWAHSARIAEIWPQILSQNQRLAASATKLIDSKEFLQKALLYAFLDIDSIQNYKELGTGPVKEKFEFTPLLHAVAPSGEEVPEEILLYMFSRSPFSALQVLSNGILDAKVGQIESLRDDYEKCKKSPDWGLTLRPAMDRLRSVMLDYVSSGDDLIQLYVAGIFKQMWRDAESRERNNPDFHKHFAKLDDPVVNALWEMGNDTQIPSIDAPAKLQIRNVFFDSASLHTSSTKNAKSRDRAVVNYSPGRES